MNSSEPQPHSGDEETQTFTSQPLQLTNETEFAVWGMDYRNGEQQDFAYRVYATTPLAGVAQGNDPAEYAVRDVAAACGLPDLVFDAEKISKPGAGTIEPTGDGIIICGKRGVIVQSKSREGPLGDADKESRWLTKHIKKGVRQAGGCHRGLMSQPLELTNYRGRKVLVDGREIEWTFVVIVNHPRLPPSYTPDTNRAGSGPGIVVLTRRDWDFLYRHLWSNCAVIKYLDRIRDDELVLGEEHMRYAKHVLHDLASERGPNDDPTQIPSPEPLPGNELDPDDAQAHFVLRTIMEYVALAQFNSDVPELKRLTLLATLDAIPVFLRTQLGGRILEDLNEAREGAVSDPISAVRVRWALDGRPFSILFAAASERTDRLEEILEESTDRCHSELKAQVGLDDVITIGVTLIPGRPSDPDGCVLLEIRQG